MTEIYSDYFQNGVYFTPPKNDILGVCIHNDGGSLSARQYDGFLVDRVNNGTLDRGFAAYYVDRNDVYVFQPTNIKNGTQLTGMVMLILSVLKLVNLCRLLMRNS